MPVLLEETMEMLAVKENGTYLDATVGLGGHSEKVLGLLGEAGRLVGIDRDEDALRVAEERLGDLRVNLRRAAFSEMDGILSSLGIKALDGVLFDLGLSMLQLKDLSRGFSFMSDDRLDMRMDVSQSLSAWHVVNKYSEKKLEAILREYGEERSAGRIARSIIERRRKSPINTCSELAGLVEGVYGGRGRIHPATRTFQALRIEVNRELDELREGLAAAAGSLRAGGRLCVISYHSLEDRIVKNFIRDSSRAGLMRQLTKKPICAGVRETRANPSSRSAKLRGAEKV
jgi:16S rRNA (cytosine1402-N4)-methyltransferase